MQEATARSRWAAACTLYVAAWLAVMVLPASSDTWYCPNNDDAVQLHLTAAGSTISARCLLGGSVSTATGHEMGCAMAPLETVLSSGESIASTCLDGSPADTIRFEGPGSDYDGDGGPNKADNCIALANAAPLDCDTDLDGYGNRCDGDFDNSGEPRVSVSDFYSFLKDFGSGVDSGVGTNMSCDGTPAVSVSDFWLFLAQFRGDKPGPSGLVCRGVTPCPSPSTTN